MKTKMWKRILSLVLALVMVAPTVLNLVPEMVQKVSAEPVTYPSYHVLNRDRKDGLYVIHSALNQNMVLDIGGGATGEIVAQCVLDEWSKRDETMRFVLQVNQKNTTTECYGIRAVTSTYWLHGYTSAGSLIGANVVGQQLDPSSEANYRNDNGCWQIVPLGDGTAYIKLTGGLYMYASGKTAGSQVKIGALPSGDDTAYRWVLEQTHMSDNYFTTGSYWIESNLKSNVTAEAPSNAFSAVRFMVSLPNDGNYGAVYINSNSLENQYRQFAIQKVSGGFYTIVCVATGNYMRCTAPDLATNKNKLEQGGSSNQAPGDYERWIIYPINSEGNTGTTSARFRIISAATGLQLTGTGASENRDIWANAQLTMGAMENYRTQTWYLKDIRSHDPNREQGQTQNTDTGVYPDTFDINDTVSLPIKIFDYQADGMLFEYASNTDTNRLGSNALHTDANGNVIYYNMGNNLSFSMVSRSDGGTQLKVTSTNTDPQWNLFNYPTPYNVGNGSGSYNNFDGNYDRDDNKYMSYYISEVRLNKSNQLTTVYPYEFDLNKTDAEIADEKKYGEIYTDAEREAASATNNSHTNPAVLVSAGTMNASGSGVDYSASTALKNALGYPMFAEQTFGNATLGLLEPGLMEVEIGGKTYTLPRYKQHTVEYIAMVLQRSLAIEKGGDGSQTNPFNYNYVSGEPTFATVDGSGSDLATLLRGVLEYYSDDANATYAGEDKLSSKFARYGTYAATLAKSDKLIGKWADVKGNIDTCMDAAYWMLNSLFLENSYNQAQNRYNSLVLTKVTSQNGKEGYIFDSTFVDSASSDGKVANSSVKYDYQSGTIRNISAAGKSFSYWKLGNSAATYAFAPVRTTDGDNTNPLGTQDGTDTPYVLDGGVLENSTDKSKTPEYTATNFNFVLQSNATFIYHEADGLFFEFEGDDDVYLFINGQLVLDIGGAHAVTGTQMELNNYVNWAWGLKNNPTEYAKLTAAEKERVNALALVEGNAYSFDFYYMERHGYGSNMRIFTNFRLVSGDIAADKTVYKNENDVATELPYGSVVQANDVLEYGFNLTNVITATIENTPNLYYLVYNDNDIGVTIDWEKGLVVSDRNVVVDKNGESLDVADLKITLINGDTRTDVSVTTQEALKALLLKGGTDAGLPAGCTLEIRGIYHKLTEQQQSNGLFHNVLSVKASTGDGNNLTSDDMGTTYVATDDTLVRVPFKPMYYQWRGHLLEVGIEKLVSDITTATTSLGEIIYSVPGLTASSITEIYLCDSMGAAASYDDVVLSESNSLEINYNATGTKFFNVYIAYTYDGLPRSVIVPVMVRVMDVTDKVFVLDYGLHVNLVFGDLFTGDTLAATDRDTVSEVLGVANENNVPVYVTRGNLTAGKLNSIAFSGIQAADGKWTITNTLTDSYDGSFQISQDTGADPYLTYTPVEFMEGKDDVYIAVRVSEKDYVTNDIGDTDINNEVEMFKKVTFMPANVVYYEDDFPAVGVTGGTFTKNTEYGQAQNKGQDEQYGHDDVYADSSDVTMSGGVITTVTIGEDFVDAATFSFCGTGFEMISRTTAVDSAIVEVSVKYPDGKWKYYPVITQFDHKDVAGDKEAVYQVPVFRLEDLPYGQYEVIISGIPTVKTSVENGQVKFEYPTTYLYIDGIRIYNPLGTGDIPEYGDENGAEFDELRGLVLGDKAAIIGLTTGKDENPGVAEGKTEQSLIGTFGANHYSFTENLNGWYTTGMAGGLDQFMVAGPNNEVYLDGTKGTYAAVLYVKEKVAGQGLLHIGVHDLHDGSFYGTDDTNASSAISFWTGESWVTPIAIGTSGTEQYYPINYKACPTVTVGDDTYYSVVIQAQSGMISFTNVKTVGLEFGALNSLSANTEYKYENGQLSKRQLNADGITWGDWEPIANSVNSALTFNVFSLRRALLNTTYADLPGDDTTGDDTTGDDTTGDDTTGDDTTDDDTSNEEIPSTDDKSWWEYLLDAFVALVKVFTEVFEGGEGMKKIYTKPVCLVEKFVLTQQICACADVQIPSTSSSCVIDNPQISDFAVPGYGYLVSMAKRNYFLDGSCTRDFSSADGNDLLCYHTSVNQAFTS